MYPEVSPIHRFERCADIVQSRCATGYQLPLSQHDARKPTILQLADPMEAGSVMAESPCRLLRPLHFGDQPAHRGFPTGEFDTGRFTDQTASAIAAHEILPPQR